MVTFWLDHFNVAVEKIGPALLIPYVRDVIRTLAMGSFKPLLREVIKSSAMLVFLDNDQNYGWAPNQNLAREMMELHTMGVDGGYSQRDVEEAARVLTGWSFQWDSTQSNAGRTLYVPDYHANGSKTVLGTTIPESGPW